MVAHNVNVALAADGAAIGGFASAKFQPLTPLVIEPGIRLDRHDYTRDREWNPRLDAALTFGRAIVRAA